MKGQTSMEFLVLLGFMMVIFTAFVFMIKGVVASRSLSSEESGLKAVGDVIKSEVDTAISVNDGYQRVFYLPKNIGGKPFETVLDGGTEVIIRNEDFDYVIFLPEAISIDDSNSGSFSEANLIIKNNGKVMIYPE